MKIETCECDDTGASTTEKKSDDDIKAELKQVKVECAEDLDCAKKNGDSSWMTSGRHFH